MDPQLHRRRITRVLLASFGLIAVIVAVSSVVGTWQARRARLDARNELANAFVSVALVSQISGDLERERLLVDTHIAEARGARMDRAAASLAEVDQDLDRAIARYEPLILFADESNRWQRVRQELAALRPLIAQTLRLSSEDRDGEARQQLALADERFARISPELARLVEINRSGGLGAVARADAKQRAANLLARVLALIAIVLTLVVGGMATRLIARREQQIVGYAARLEMHNRELDAFAGRVAHDLRGPLTAMTMAATGLDGQRDHGSTLEIIRRSVARMEQLIRDLLALSQVEAQSLGATCDPKTVATIVRDEQLARAEADHVTIAVDVEPARIRGREGLLIEALSNLIDSAIKYARAEVAPAIELHGRARDDDYELRVADNGMGMSLEEVRRAFEPFYRARRAKAPGTGLGLSIVKRVAEASGGSVSVQSSLGSGTTFVLRFPLAGA